MKANFGSITGTPSEPQLGTVEKVKNFFSFVKNETVNEDVNATENSGMLDKIKNNFKNTFEVEKSYKTFFIFLFVGLGLIFLSLIFLPAIVLAPTKFVGLFSLGSLIILTSFIFIYGTSGYLDLLFSASRVTFTLMFLLSLIVSFYFSLIKNNYIISLICAVIQLVTLIIFTLSFIPGGQMGISFILEIIKSPFSSLWMKIKGGSYLPQ